jgi:hypothetical protein
VKYGDVAGIAAASIAALSRDWPEERILEIARTFAYTPFCARLAGQLSS